MYAFTYKKIQEVKTVRGVSLKRLILTNKAQKRELQCYRNVLNAYLGDMSGYVLMHNIVKLYS